MGGWFIFRQISAESGRVGRSDKGKKEARVGCLRLQKKFELHVINFHQNVAPSSSQGLNWSYVLFGSSHWK